MGVNRWTPDQWREYNRQTGDRHVTRALPPIPRWAVLREDLSQQVELHRLTRRRADHPDEYKRREMAFVRKTLPMTYGMSGEDTVDDDR